MFKAIDGLSKRQGGHSFLHVYTHQTHVFVGLSGKKERHHLDTTNALLPVPYNPSGIFWANNTVHPDTAKSPVERRHVQEGFHIFHYQTAFGCFWAMVAEVLIRHRLIDLAAQL